jgi:hypothetical protein
VVGVTPSSKTRSPEQRVDEGALARVEFPDDDDHEQLVELPDRSDQGAEVWFSRRQRDQDIAQPCEMFAHIDELPLRGRREQAGGSEGHTGLYRPSASPGPG